MRIIKPGKLPEIKPQIFNGTCVKCGCQVEVPECEVQSSGVRTFSAGPSITRYYVKCPTLNCGAIIDLREILFRGQ